MNVDRPLPADEFAEESVVAAVLVDPDAAERLLTTLKPAAFYIDKHATIWQAARECYQTYGPTGVNQVTVANRLSECGQLEQIGGQTWLATLVYRLPTSMGAEHYGDVVAKEAHKRVLLQELRRAEASLYGAECDPEAVTTNLVERVMRVQSRRQRSVSRIAWDVGGEYREHLDQYLRDPSALLGPSWGYGFLDAATKGMRPCVGMLLARTGVGKSLMVMNIARNVTAAGEYVLMFTTEMTDLDSFSRYMFMTAEMNPGRPVARGFVEEYERERIEQAFDNARGRPMVLSGGSWELGAIVSDIRRRNTELGCRVVMIDHLDYVRCGRLEGTEKIIEILKTLVKLADDLQVHILFVSHSTKEGTKEPWPRLSHAKWAGEKETDSSIGMTMAPANWVPTAGWQPIDRAEAAKMRKWGALPLRLSLEKNRFGFEGDCYLVQDWSRGGQITEVGEEEAKDLCEQYRAFGMAS